MDHQGAMSYHSTLTIALLDMKCKEMMILINLLNDTILITLCQAIH